MMFWRRQIRRLYSEKKKDKAAVQMNIRFFRFAANLLQQDRKLYCSSGGYQMFVKFVCFVLLGFILTYYFSKKNYATVLCEVSTHKICALFVWRLFPVFIFTHNASNADELCVFQDIIRPLN